MIKTFMFVLLSFSITQAQEISTEVDTSEEVVVALSPDALKPIMETETNIYVSIDGNKMNSVADVRNLVAESLKQPPITGNRQAALQSLLELLGNSANTPKRVDITITSGAVLESKIGKRALRQLLDVLTQAEQLNKDEIGISNLAILYWQ